MATSAPGQFNKFVFGNEIRGGDAVFYATSDTGGDQGGSYWLSYDHYSSPIQGSTYKDAAFEFIGEDNLLIVGGNYKSSYNSDYSVRPDSMTYNFYYGAGVSPTSFGGTAWNLNEVAGFALQNGRLVSFNRYGTISGSYGTYRTQGNVTTVTFSSGISGVLEGATVRTTTGDVYSLTGIKFATIDPVSGDLKTIVREKNLGRYENGLLYKDGKISSLDAIGNVVETSYYYDADNNIRLFAIDGIVLGKLDGSWIVDSTKNNVLYWFTTSGPVVYQAYWEKDGATYKLYSDASKTIYYGTIGDTSSPEIKNGTKNAYFAASGNFLGYIMGDDVSAGKTNYLIANHETTLGDRQLITGFMTSSGKIVDIAKSSMYAELVLDAEFGWNVYHIYLSDDPTAARFGRVFGDYILGETKKTLTLSYYDKDKTGTVDAIDAASVYVMNSRGERVRAKGAIYYIPGKDNFLSRYNGCDLFYRNGYVWESTVEGSAITSTKLGVLTDKGILMAEDEFVTEEKNKRYLLFDSNGVYTTYYTQNGKFYNKDGREILLNSNYELLGFADSANSGNGYLDGASGNTGLSPQKTISAVKFASKGKINFTAQTGATDLYVSGASEPTSSPVMDRGIRIKAESLSLIPLGASTKADGSGPYLFGSISFDAYGILSGSGDDTKPAGKDYGTFKVISDLSADITAISTVSVLGLTVKDSLASNARNNRVQTAAIRADDFYLKNNFNGILTAQSSYIGRMLTAEGIDGNSVASHGIFAVTGDINVNGYWGDCFESGYWNQYTNADDRMRGVIFSTVKDTELISDYAIVPAKPPLASFSSSASNNTVGAYGLRADSGTINLKKYDGYINSVLDGLIIRSVALGDVANTVSGNKVYSKGLSAKNINLADLFTGSIRSEMKQLRFHQSGGKPTNANNAVMNASVYADEKLFSAGRMYGTLYSYTNSYYATSDVDTIESSSFITAAIYAGSELSLNNGKSMLSTTLTNETRNVSSWGTSNVYGIFAPKLSASAMDSNITLNVSNTDARSIGLKVDTYHNAADKTFDITGDITITSDSSVRVAILQSTEALNMRLASNILISGAMDAAERYAVFSGNVGGPHTYTKLGFDDLVEIASGVTIEGNLDLTEGKNTFRIDSNAVIKGDLLSMNGYTNIELILNRWSAVDDKDSSGVSSWMTPKSGNDSFMIQTPTGETGMDSRATISINLNDAASGTYLLMSGLNNKTSTNWLARWTGSTAINITLTFASYKDVRFNFIGKSADASGVITANAVNVFDLSGKVLFTVTGKLTTSGEFSITVDRLKEFTATELVANPLNVTVTPGKLSLDPLQIDWKEGVANTDKSDCSNYVVSYTKKNSQDVSIVEEIGYSTSVHSVMLNQSSDAILSGISVRLATAVANPGVSPLDLQAQQLADGSYEIRWVGLDPEVQKNYNRYRVTYTRTLSNNTTIREQRFVSFDTVMIDVRCGTGETISDVTLDVVNLVDVNSISLQSSYNLETKTARLDWSYWGAKLDTDNFQYEVEYCIVTYDENDLSKEVDRTNSIVANLSYKAEYFEIQNVEWNQKVLARVRLNNKGSSANFQNGEWSSPVEISSNILKDEYENSLTIGEITGTNVKAFGNSGGSALVQMDWNNSECQAGLNFYEVNYFSCTEAVLKQIEIQGLKEEDIWKALEQTTSTDEYGNRYITAINGTVLADRVTLYRKTTSANSLFVSGIATGQTVYWRVRATSNTYGSSIYYDPFTSGKGVGEFQAGESMKVDTKDLNPPIIYAPDEAEKIDSVKAVKYTFVSNDISTRSFTVQWNQFARDANGETKLKGYKLYYVKLDSAGNEIGDYIYCPLQEAETVASFSIDLSKLDARSDYRWFISAMDYAGNQSTPSVADKTIGTWYGDKDAVANIGFVANTDIAYEQQSAEWYQVLSFTVDISADTLSDKYTPSGTYKYVLQLKELDNTTGEEVWVNKATKFTSDLSAKEIADGKFLFNSDQIQKIKKGVLTNGENEWRLLVYDTAGNVDDKTISTPFDMTAAKWSADKRTITVTPTYNYGQDTADIVITWNSAIDVDDSGSSYGQSGVYKYTITVTDASGTEIGKSIIDIANPNNPPPLKYELKGLSATELDKYTITIEVQDKIGNKKNGVYDLINTSVTFSNDPPFIDKNNIRQTIVNYDANGKQEVTLQWMKVTNVTVKYYTISYRLQGTSAWTSINKTPAELQESSSILSLVIPNLANGMYDWKISATNERGKTSADVIGLQWGKDTQTPFFADDAKGTSVVNGYREVIGQDFYGINVTVSWDSAQDPSQVNIPYDYRVNSSGIASYNFEYRYKVADGDFGDWITVEGIQGNSYTFTAAAGNGTYEWRVSRPIDHCGNVLSVGQKGYYLTDTVGWQGDTTKPVFDSELKVFTPTFSNKQLTVPLSWASATDTESGILGYAIYYRLTGSMEWTLANSKADDPQRIDWSAAKYNKGTGLWEYTIAGVIPANKSYECRVVAYDKAGNSAEKTGTFDGDITPPEFNEGEKATIVYIPDANNPLANWKQNVTVSWNAASDGDPTQIVVSGISYYTLQFKLETEPESVYNKNTYVIRVDEFVNPDAPYYELTGLVNGNYTCRITATDHAGNTTAIADGIEFTWAGDSTGPEFKDAAIKNISYVEETTFYTVTVNWKAASDSESGVRGYKIAYQPVGDEDNQWVWTDLLSADTRSYSVTVNGGFGDAKTSWNWKIVAIDNVGNETEVSIGATNGDITAPIFGNSSATVKVNYDNYVKLSWATATEDDKISPQSGVKGYYLTISSVNNGGTTVVLQDIFVSTTTYNFSGAGVLKDGSYVWSVVAEDYAGNRSTALAGDTFIIDTKAPHGPNGDDSEGWFTQLPEPVISVVYNWFPQPGTKNDTTTPVEVRDPASITITFDASNNNYADLMDIYYVYEISTDGTFRDASQLLYSSLRNSDYSYTYDKSVYEKDKLVLSTDNNGITRLAGFAPGTTFYWRARAVDTRGHFASNWSHQVRSFQLKDEAGTFVEDLYTGPTIPTSIGVTKNLLYDNIYTVSWVASSDAFGISKYILHIANEKESQETEVSADLISDLRIASSSVVLNSGTYKFKVKAVDGSGKSSAWSDTFSYTVSEEFGTENGSSSSWAYTLQNATLGTNVYTVTPRSGSVGLSTDHKDGLCWYKFDLLNLSTHGLKTELLPGLLSLTITGVNSPLTISILDDAKKTIKSFSVSGSGGISNLLIDPAKYGERIYVSVKAKNKGVGVANYTISGNMTSFPEEFVDNANFEQVTYWPTGAGARLNLYSEDGVNMYTVSSGWVGYKDAADFYMIQGEKAGLFSGLDVYNVKDKVKVTLYGGDRKKIATKTITSSASNLFAGYLVPDAYYISFESGDNGKGKMNTDYTFLVKETYLPGPAASSDPANVASLENGRYTISNEWAGFGDPKAYYNFYPQMAGGVFVSLSNVTEGMKLKVTIQTALTKKTVTVTGKGSAPLSNIFKNELLAATSGFSITVEAADGGKGKQNAYYDLIVEDRYYPNNGDSPSNPMIISMENKQVNEWVGYGDTQNFYQFEVKEDGIVKVDLFAKTSNVKVTLYDANGSLIKSASVKGDKYSIFGKNGNVLAAGKYLISVDAGKVTNPKKNTYFDFSVSETQSFAAKQAANANNDWNSAVELTVGLNNTKVNQWVGFGDSVNYYKFKVTGDEKVTPLLAKVSSGANVKMEIYDAYGAKISASKLMASPDYYYIKVYTPNETKNYSNTFNIGLFSK